MWWKTALSWTWRLLLVLPAVASAWLVLMVDGTAGETHGFLRVAAWLVPIAAAPTWLLFWRRPGRAQVTAIAAVVALALSVWLTVMAPLMPSRIAEAVDDLDVPGGLVDEHRTGQSIWGSRPTLDRTYRTERDELEALVDELRRDGWSLRADRQWRQVRAHRDEVALTATVNERHIDLSFEPR